MDTGYPALISDPLVTPPDPQAPKASQGLVPDESPTTSSPSEPSGSPPTIANAT